MKILGQEGLNFIATKYKELRDSLSGYAKKEDLDTKISKSQMSKSFTIASDEKVLTTQGSYDLYNQLYDLTETKVDKENGKQLSSNDYTNEAKAKVDAIPADPKYTDTVQDLSEYAKETEIKTKLSEMTDDTTHRLVTDTEKEMLYNKVGLEDITTTFNFKPPTQVETPDTPDPPVPDGPYSPDNPDRTKHIPKVVSTDVLYDMIKKYELYNLIGVKKQVILTQSQYDALSSTDKNDASKIYFIKA